MKDEMDFEELWDDEFDIENHVGALRPNNTKEPMTMSDHMVQQQGEINCLTERVMKAQEELVSSLQDNLELSRRFNDVISDSYKLREAKDIYRRNQTEYERNLVEAEKEIHRLKQSNKDLRNENEKVKQVQKTSVAPTSGVKLPSVLNVIDDTLQSNLFGEYSDVAMKAISDSLKKALLDSGVLNNNQTKEKQLVPFVEANSNDIQYISEVALKPILYIINQSLHGSLMGDFNNDTIKCITNQLEEDLLDSGVLKVMQTEYEFVSMVFSDLRYDLVKAGINDELNSATFGVMNDYLARYHTSKEDE